jgi:hypothetical protein
LLYDRVVELQNGETIADRKEVLRLRTEQRFVRRLIAVFEPWVKEKIDERTF